MQNSLELSHFIALSKNNPSTTNTTTTTSPVRATVTIIADPKRHIHPLNLLKQTAENYSHNDLITVKSNDAETIRETLKEAISREQNTKNTKKDNKELIIILSENDSENISEILKELKSDASLVLDQKELKEGAFILKTIKINQVPIIIIAGGGIPGIVYGTNEFLKKCNKQENTLIIPNLDIQEIPSLPYRIFFTWDHSTNWDVENSGQQDIGFANPYLKTKEAFLRDYKRIIDFISLNRINGLIIYGFLRDSHGGIEAAQELCQYAKERGVRIIPGVGINAYGAIYWEGNHQYNLSNWLEKNPHLKATAKRIENFDLTDFAPIYVPKTHYLDRACPSKKENENFHEEAIQWLAENFEIGGINFETGDYGTCECNECTERRQKNKQWSHEDMARLYPRLFAAAKAKRPDLWTICEAYWDNILDLEALEPLKQVPQNAVFQYCTNRGYLVDRVFKELTPEHVAKVPGQSKILRTHMGSQWQNERYTLVAERYAKMMQVAHTNKMHGATIFAEPSDFSVANEINYLAFGRFGYNAKLTWDQFIKQDLAPLFGGEKEAQEYLALLDPARHHDIKSLNDCLAKALTMTRSIDHNDQESHRRWVWLQNHLYQKLSMKQKISATYHNLSKSNSQNKTPTHSSIKSKL